MLRRYSITLAAVGFAGFMTVFGLVLNHKPDPHALMWPMMAFVTMMAIGMIGFTIIVNRTQRNQAARQ